MSELVLTTHREHIFEITINRPEKRNALSLEVMQALDSALSAAERAPGVRAVLLRGAGKAFSAGIDLAALMGLPNHYGDNWLHQMPKISDDLQRIVTRFERSHLPTIALIHGHCLGMAMELVLACDLRIATADARLGLPETRLGLIPDVGGTTRLTRLAGVARAKELIMTGKQIDAAQAEQWGIVNYVVESSDDLLASGEALAAELAQAAPLAVARAKRVIDALADVDRGLQIEAIAQAHLIQTQDFTAGVQAMISKQPARWQGV